MSDPLQDAFGKWPGDETDEDLAAALQESLDGDTQPGLHEDCKTAHLAKQLKEFAVALANTPDRGALGWTISAAINSAVDKCKADIGRLLLEFLKKR